MADATADLRDEFDASRRELNELAEDLALAETQLADLARRDVQVPDLRAMLERTRRKHAQLEARECALRARFRAVLSEQNGGTYQ